MTESDEKELLRHVDRMTWDLAALTSRISEMNVEMKLQSGDIEKLRTWRAQMVAVLFAGTTAISLLIKKFWN